MNRCSFLFITLLALCVFTLSTGHLQAQATLPVLNTIAKKAPQAKTLPALSSPTTDKTVTVNRVTCSPNTLSGRPVILGSKGSISSVKERVAKISCATTTKSTVTTRSTIKSTRKSTRKSKKIDKTILVVNALPGAVRFVIAP